MAKKQPAPPKKPSQKPLPAPKRGERLKKGGSSSPIKESGKGKGGGGRPG